MAIETVEGVGTIYTGDDTRLFRLMALRGMLRLELAGMRRRGPSALSVVKREFGLRGNRQRVCDQFFALVAAKLEARRTAGA